MLILDHFRSFLVLVTTVFTRILVIASRISLSSYGVIVRVRVVLMKEPAVVGEYPRPDDTHYELLIPLGSNHLLGYLLSVFCCLLPLRVRAGVQSETFRS